MRLRDKHGRIIEICDNDLKDQHHVPSSGGSSARSYYGLKPGARVFIDGKLVKLEKGEQLTGPVDQLFLDMDDE